MVTEPNNFDHAGGNDFDIVDDDADEQDRPPSREEFERTKRALAKANREGKKHRLQLREVLASSSDSNGDDKKRELDRERIRDEVSEVEESRWKKRVVRQAAKASLLQAGLIGDATKLARLIDEDNVDVDEDGEVTDGLDEQIEEIRGDYPDLFEDRTAERKQRRQGLRGIDGGDRGDRRPARTLSSAERIQEMALRGGKR